MGHMWVSIVLINDPLDPTQGHSTLPFVVHEAIKGIPQEEYPLPPPG